MLIHDTSDTESGDDSEDETDCQHGGGIHSNQVWMARGGWTPLTNHDILLRLI